MSRESIETRRQQLVQAGLEVLEEEGLSRVSTRSVATRAGVPLSTVHYCFSSKEDLLRQMLEAALARDQASVLDDANQGRDFADTLALGLAALVRDAVQHPRRTVAHTELSVYALRHPASVALAQAQYATLLDAANALLALAVGRSRRPRQPAASGAAELVACAMDGIMMRACVMGDAAGTTPAVAFLVDAVERLTRSEAPRRGDG